MPVPIIKEVVEVKKLSNQEAALARPGQLVGTVLAQVDWGACFFQDEGAGVFIFFDKGELMTGLKVGSRISLEGVTESGYFAPIVHANKLMILGEHVPTPILLPLSRPTPGSWAIGADPARGGHGLHRTTGPGGEGKTQRPSPKHRPGDR